MPDIVLTTLNAKCTDEITPPMITLPAVSLTMVRACRIGTPLPTSVPNVWAKREMAAF